MNDKDYKFAAFLALLCLACSLAFVAYVLLATPARAAALLDIGGEKIVVMTADEFRAFAASMESEIARLKARPCT